MERYSIIFDRMHNLYAKDTKIIIERAVITKDNDTGELFAQIKMSNLFPKTLVAVKVMLTGFDSSNKKIEEKEFSYFDLAVNQGREFGQKTPLRFSNNAVRSFDIRIAETVYSDGSKLTNCKTGLLALPKAEPLTGNLSAAQISDYRMKNTACAKYIPDGFSDLWLCTCGRWNISGNNSCYYCGAEREKQKHTYYTAHLNNEIEENEENNSFSVKDRYKSYAIAGMISAAIGLFFCSVIFSSAAIILGAIVISESAGEERERTTRRNYGITAVFGGILGFVIMLVAVFGFGKNGLIPFAKTTNEAKYKAYVEEHIGREHSGRVTSYKSVQISDDGDADILFEWDSGLTNEYGKIGETELDKSGNILLCSICSYLEMQDNYRQYGQDNYSPGRTDDSNDYLFPSDRVYISESDLDYRGQYEISLIRNEIYARHGYVFKTEPYKSYFESKSWYYPNEYFSDGSFNDVEKANVKFITEYEKAMGWR